VDARDRVASICEAQGWTVLEMLRVHTRKRTATARVRIHDGREAVLKCLLAGAPVESEQGLVRERDVYASELVSIAPRLIVGDATWFCRNYEPGMPLRTWILEHPSDAETQLPAYLHTVVTSLASSKQPGDADAVPLAAAQAKGRFKNLLTSGPAGTTRNPLVLRSARLFAGVSGKQLEPMVARAVQAWTRRGACYASALSHNDLHADNVLASEEGPRIVDFENVTRPGFWWIDALYLTAACYATLRAPAARERLVGALHQAVIEAEPMIAQELQALTQIFCAAAASNRRCRSDAPMSLHDLRCISAVPGAVQRFASGERRRSDARSR